MVKPDGELLERTVPAVVGDAADDADTRTRLLRAAAAAVAEHGWAGVRTRDVARRAGVNNALVHYYFGTKERLLAEAVARTLAEAFGESEEILAGADSLQEAVRGLIAWIGRLDPGAPELRIAIELLVGATRTEAMRGPALVQLDGFRAALAGLAAADRARGALDPGLDPDAVGALVSALLDGLVMHRLVDPDVDLDAATATIDALLAAGTRRTRAPATTTTRRRT